MTITLTDIKQLYPDCYVEQVDNKQLFIVTRSDKVNLLISYKTIIGVKPAFDYWHITTAKYSQSTSKQITQFINSYHPDTYIFRVSERQLQEIVNY